MSFLPTASDRRKYSIECYEKNHQPFRLSGVRFEGRVIQIFLDENLLGAGPVKNELSTPESPYNG